MKPRLLVVEDDEATSRQLFWTLSGPYDVLIAHDMQTAVRRAMLYQPSVSIVDLYLPPCPESPETGLRMVEYIKSHLPKSKIVVVGSASTNEMQQACYAIGAAGFLDKPFETEQLLAVMRRIEPAQRFDFV